MSEEIEKVPESVELPEETPEAKPQETALTSRGIAAMQGLSPEGQALLDDRDRLREQQAQELAADLEAFRNRPKPPWVDMSSVVEDESDEVPKVEARGFDASGVLTNQDVEDYLTESFPPRHLNKLESINYVPEYVAKPDGILQGNWYPTEPANIVIYQHEPEAREQTPDQMKETIAHEVGHNAFFNSLSEDQRQAWLHLSAAYPVWDPRDYASVNAKEDFAESYKMYVTDPAFLEIKSQERYGFLRTSVFGGKEYQ